MSRSCKEGRLQIEEVGRVGSSLVQNLVPARNFHREISVKICHASCNLCTQDQFICIDRLDSCFTCERCNMSSINKKIRPGSGNPFKRFQRTHGKFVFLTEQKLATKEE